MTRIKSLSNERYAEKKEAITRILREHFGSVLREPVPKPMTDALNKLHGEGGR